VIHALQWAGMTLTRLFHGDSKCLQFMNNPEVSLSTCLAKLSMQVNLILLKATRRKREKEKDLPVLRRLYENMLYVLVHTAPKSLVYECYICKPVTKATALFFIILGLITQPRNPL
jgi:hypothetical protein